MAHWSVLRQALAEFDGRPLLILPEQSNIDAVAAGRRCPTWYGHSKYSRGEYWHTKAAPRDADILQLATGRQLLEEVDALLHGLRRHGVLTRTSLECT